MRNSIRLFLILVLALCAFGCSNGPGLGATGGEAGDSGVESLGSTHQALASCPYPIGAHGTQYYKPIGFITGVHVGSAPSKLSLEFTYVGSAVKDYAEIDYGPNHIAFSGPGWTGHLNNRYLSTTMYTPGSNCDPTNSNLYCWYINGQLALFMDQQLSVQLSSSGFVTQFHGNGVTKFTGRGATDPQKLRVWWDTGSSMYSTDWSVLGPAMTACL